MLIEFTIIDVWMTTNLMLNYQIPFHKVKRLNIYDDDSFENLENKFFDAKKNAVNTCIATNTRNLEPVIFQNINLSKAEMHMLVTIAEHTH